MEGDDYYILLYTRWEEMAVLIRMGLINETIKQKRENTVKSSEEEIGHTNTLNF